MQYNKLFATALAALLMMSCAKSDDYKLVWQDEFDGAEINTDYWNFEDNARGGGNAELQYYTPRNASIEKHPVTGESCLVLNAKREDYAYTNADGTEGFRPATSVRMNTQDKVTFLYGKLEARICFPHSADGMWPAFWMLGNDLVRDLGNDDSIDDKVDSLAAIGQTIWPKCGEIDICEMGHVSGIERGTQDRRFNGAAHWGESWNNGAYPNAANFVEADYPLQGEFHTWTVIREPDTLAMYLDLDKNPDAEPYFALSLRDKEINGAGRYFNKPAYILFNLAVGGFFPGMPAPGGKYPLVIPADCESLQRVSALPEDGTPVKMYVDYVRIYERK